MTKMKNIKTCLINDISCKTLDTIINAANEANIPYNEVFIGQKSEYGDNIVSAYYYREENDYEYKKRLGEEEEYKKKNKEREYKDYIKLKKQFEGK